MELKDLDNLRGERTKSLMAILVWDDARVESGQTEGGREREKGKTRIVIYCMSYRRGIILFSTKQSLSCA